jgi:transposase
MPIRPYDNKNQLFLLPPSVNEWVRADHPARVLSDVVDHLDVSGFRDVSREGRPCYDPRMMVKVLLWGYATGVRASRKIEERLHSDVVFMWLAGLQKPDFRTICLFRKDNQPAIEGLFAQVLMVAKQMGFLKLGLVALDGTKLRASAGIGSFKQVSEWRKELAKAQAEVRRMLADAEAQDAADDARYGSDRRGDELPEGLADAKERVRKIESLLGHLDGGTEATQRVSMTDPESRYMHTQTGSQPAYNAQVAVTRDQIIVHADVTTEPVDTNQLVPAIEGIRSLTGRKPKQLVADTGYRSGSNLRALERARVEGYLPETEERNIGRLKRGHPELYGKEAFKYDKRRCCYSCPAGQTLDPYTLSRRKTKYGGGVTAVFRAAPGVCAACSQRERCTTDSRNGRAISRNDYEEERQRMRQKLATDEGRAIYGKRKCIVEPTIGQLKMVGGIIRLLLRGLSGAKIEWKWATTAHNLLKLSRLVVGGTAKLAWAT